MPDAFVRSRAMEMGIADCDLVSVGSATADYEMRHLQLDNHYSAVRSTGMISILVHAIVKTVKQHETDAFNEGISAYYSKGFIFAAPNSNKSFVRLSVILIAVTSFVLTRFPASGRTLVNVPQIFRETQKGVNRQRGEMQ